MSKQGSGEWWAEITHAFQAHVREEGEFLESYSELVAGIEDPGTRFLVELILEDERRHHELFERLVGAVRGEEGVAVPAPPAPSAEGARRLREPTERFLAAEREDRERLHALARDLKPLRHDTLWYLLVQIMEIDTRKHVLILEYLRGRLAELD